MWSKMFPKIIDANMDGQTQETMANLVSPKSIEKEKLASTAAKEKRTNWQVEKSAP